MPLTIWTWFTNIVLALLIGLGWVLGIMWHWYWMMDVNYWDGSAPDVLFVLHLIFAVFGGVILGYLVFGWADRRTKAHDAVVLRKLWIDRRRGREMTAIFPQNLRNIS